MARLPVVAALAAFAGLAAAAPAVAQGFDLFHQRPQTAQAPPADVPGQASPEDDQAAALLLRVNRLEDQLRQANGRIEQLENAQRRLEDQLQKFRQDVEFRFRERSGEAAPAAGPAATATAAADAPAAVTAGAPAVVAAALAPDAAAPKPKRSDAFDPASQPNALGAPQPLGATAPSAPLAPFARPMPAPKPAAGPPLELGGAPQPGDAPATGGPTVVGSGVAMLDAPREQYNSAVQAFQGGQYQQAEDGFKAFMAANPGHRLTPDAVFFIGESYFQRARPREAAEQYLKVTTDYARSSRAPESMVRLGQTLIALGNKDQACETFAEFGRRYPSASASVKRLADREMAKDHC